jgi:hypothetical protein
MFVYKENKGKLKFKIDKHRPEASKNFAAIGFA